MTNFSFRAFLNRSCRPDSKSTPISQKTAVWKGIGFLGLALNVDTYFCYKYSRRLRRLVLCITLRVSEFLDMAYPTYPFSLSRNSSWVPLFFVIFSDVISTAAPPSSQPEAMRLARRWRRLYDSLGLASWSSSCSDWSITTCGSNRARGIKSTHYGHLPQHFHLHSGNFGIVSRSCVVYVWHKFLDPTIER